MEHSENNNAQQPNGELLNITGLQLEIDGNHPVDGVEFSVGAGEFVALVGASGSGKTLSALAAIGLLPPAVTPTGGSIRFRGTELLELKKEQWRDIRGAQIAMIFQEPMTSLNPVMTLGAQLSEAVRKHSGCSRSEALLQSEEALRAVQMPEPKMCLKSYPHQLSGGLRQRGMIAMALSCRPALLIADEPTTALDVTVQASVIELLQTIRRERNLAILFITHDIALAAGVVDRIVVIENGKTVESGPAERIVKKPQHPYTVAMIDRCLAREI